MTDLFLILMGVIGAGMIVWQYYLEHTRVISHGSGWSRLMEHGASALIVASVIGLTYERISHRDREAKFQRFIREHRKATFEALEAYVSLRPTDIFMLISDIALQTHRCTGSISTLYRPARSENQEYTFANSVEYFDKIVRVARMDVVDVLDGWISKESPLSLNFLAADFVGKYRLRELSLKLRELGRETLKNADRISDEKKDCALNQLWAASRCEKVQYRILAEMIKDTADPHIIEWILFVPQQMRDRGLLNVVEAFLARNDVPSPREIDLVHTALAELSREFPDEVEQVLSSFSSKLGSSINQEDIRRIWSHGEISSASVISIIARGDSETDAQTDPS